MTLSRYLLLGCLAASAASSIAQAPDLLFLHGNILTGSHLVPSQRVPGQMVPGQAAPGTTPPRVSAIAVRDGIIVAVGTDAAISRLGSAQTKVVDLKGAFAMPGFNDAHVHLWSAGAQKALSVDLDHTQSLAEMLDRIRGYIARNPSGAGGWIQGAGWDHTLWPGKILPGRLDLDRITAGHPAIFYRTDGHILVANSAALAAAGITADTPDPAGARIDRDASGNPTGIVRETPAMKLLEAVIPPPSTEQRRQALSVAIHDALAHGVTSVQDYSPDLENFLAYESMERAHLLKLRITEWLDFDLPLPVLEQRRTSHPADDPLLRYGMLKGFMDGSLGSRTAALAAPYSDDPENSGIPRYQQDRLNQLASERSAAGFQLGFHAIGDRANDMALNAFAAAEQVWQPARLSTATANASSLTPASTPPTGPPTSPRFRIEHAQVLLPGDFARFSDLGVIASMQPSHLLTDMNWASSRLGDGRSKYAYAWRSFLDHHVKLAFGTDYPVESIDPFRGLYAAITRQNEAGTQTFEPDEKLSIQRAIYAYTQGSAYAAFREHELGRLEPGFLADMVVLDRDPMTATPQQLLHTRVLRTVVGGQTVFAPPGEN